MTVRTDAAGLDLGRFLQRGDRIVIGQACGEPTTLVEALIAQGNAIGDLSAFIATSFSGLLIPDTAGSFALSSMGAIGALRQMSKAGRLAIIPAHVSQIGPMIEARIIGCDVAFVQVSPADADGHHSFGLIGDHVQAAVAKARVVIAGSMIACRSPTASCCPRRGSTARCMSRAHPSRSRPRRSARPTWRSRAMPPAISATAR